MCFVIAGVQPKTKKVEETPRRCPQCGLHQAYLQQVDHYISLFFIPLVRIKRGETFLYCQRCRQPVDNMDNGAEPSSYSGRRDHSCRLCGRTVQDDHRYCPYCGQQR